MAISFVPGADSDGVATLGDRHNKGDAETARRLFLLCVAPVVFHLFVFFPPPSSWKFAFNFDVTYDSGRVECSPVYAL